MRTHLVLAFTLAGALSANAQQRTVTSYYFACKSPADLIGLTDAVKKNDDAEFDAIAKRVFPENSCALLVPSEIVQLERTNAAGQDCVRRKQEPVCLWTDETAFRP